MRFARLSTLTLLCLALAACSSPASRISDNQAAFDTYPLPVQEKIRKGDIDVGFTPEQVQLSLGKPDRVFSRQTEMGSTEVWAYRTSSPALSFGLGGFGFGGGHSSVGGGLGVGTGGEEEDKVRVVFGSGRVASVERTVK